MSTCININDKNFKDLVEKSGLNSLQLEAKMQVWMKNNNTDVAPTLEQLNISYNKVKPGVDFIFDKNPEIAEIGSREQYSEYIESIFPNSEIKDVVFHASPNEFEEFFDNKAGTFVDRNKDRIVGMGENLYAVVIDVESPYIQEDETPFDLMTPEAYNFGLEAGTIVTGSEIVLFNSKKAHILGTKKDLSNFKKFVESVDVKKTDESPGVIETFEVKDEYSLFDESENESEEYISKEQQEAEDFKRKFGDLNVDELEGADKSKFKNLILLTHNQRNDLKSELSMLRDEFKSSKDSVKKAQLASKINDVQERIDELTEKISKIIKLNATKDIPKYGQQAVAEVKAILSNDNITVKQLLYAKRLIDFWRATAEMANVRNPLFKGGNIPRSILNELVEIATLMNSMELTVEKLMDDKIISLVREEHGERFSKDDIFKAISDISAWTANVRSMGEVSDPLVTAIYKAMKRADHLSAEEYTDKKKFLKEKFDKAKAVLKSLKKNGQLYHALLQEEGGKYTGNLVTIFKKAFYTEKSKLRDKALESNSAVDWKNYYDWVNDNEISIDYRLLFPDENTLEIFRGKEDVLKKMADEHKARVLAITGQAYFDILMKGVDSDLERYNYSRQAFINQLNTQGFPETTVKQLTIAWEKANSPYYEIQRRTGVLKSDGTFGSKSVKHAGQFVHIGKNAVYPRTLPNEKWQDQKFNAIKSNKELYDLYNAIMDIMSYSKIIMPDSVSNDIGIGTLPFVLKNTKENFSSGFQLGFSDLISKIQGAFMEKTDTITDYSEKDVLTGAKVKRPVLKSFILSKRQVEAEDKKLTLEFYTKNGRMPNDSENESIRQQAIDNLNAQRSFDLEGIMELYLANVISYKYKEMSYDIITLAKNSLLRKKMERVESKSGEQQENVLGEKEEKMGLKHLEDLVNFSYDVWLGIDTKKSTGVSKNKSYTHKDKSELNSIIHQQDLLKEKLDKKLIKKEEYDVLNSVLEEQLEKIGGHLALSKAGDALLQYVQLKGMALNPIAGTVNLLVGWMENSIKAADGRYYSSKDLYSSYRDVFAMVFDPKSNKAGAKKMIAIDQLFNITGKQSQELFDRSGGKIEEYLYKIQDKTEFVNTMSQAAAFMKSIKVKDNKGSEATFFEALDENGKVKDGWVLSDKMSNTSFVFEMKSRLDELRKMTHGNYSDKMMFKSHVLGRMVMQFRTWIPEMYEARWGKEDYNYILKENIKGRWRSFATLGKTNFGGNQYSALQNTLYTTGQLCKQMLFMKTSFNDRMSPVDAANMKANLMELHFLIGSIILSLILGSAFDDDDKKRLGVNSLINILTRQQTDILMFANPTQFETISKNIIPIMGLVSDIEKVGVAAAAQFGDTPDYDRGTYVGMNKLTVNSVRMIPILNQGLRIYQYNDQKLNK